LAFAIPGPVTSLAVAGGSGGDTASCFSFSRCRKVVSGLWWAAPGNNAAGTTWAPRGAIRGPGILVSPPGSGAGTGVRPKSRGSGAGAISSPVAFLAFAKGRREGITRQGPPSYTGRREGDPSTPGSPPCLQGPA